MAYSKVKPLYRPKRPVGPALNSGYLNMKWLGVLLLPPLDGMLVHRRGYPQHICWYPFVHLGEEEHFESKVSCQEHNTMTPAKARTWTTRSGVECNNHEASAAYGDTLFPFIFRTLK